MLNTTRLPLRMLAFGYDAFTSSGVRHWARPTIASQAFVLRPCRFDPPVADVCLEVALDDLGTDDEHLLKYGTDFQKLEDGYSLPATQTSPGNGRNGLFIAVSLSEFTIAHAV